MYCVIQELKLKKPPYQPTSKLLEVSVTTWSIDGVVHTTYGYKNSSEKFNRPIRTAYKICIHESYRENGKVKKRQCHICTMEYYKVLEFGPADCILHSKLQDKLKELDIEERVFWEMVYQKLDPIIARIKEEYEETEEFKVSQEHRRIIREYLEAKEEFEKKYGENSYKYCYDVFGTLRNEEYLKKLKLSYESKKQHESGYHKKEYSNYDWSNFGGYREISQSNYTSSESELAKKIIALGYKQLAMRLHPDNGGTKEEFQELGNLKDKLLKNIN